MGNPVTTYQVQGYRAGESQPKSFNASDVAGMAKAAQYAVDNLDVPKLAVTTLPARMLMEGRIDAGTNNYNTNNPAAVKVFNSMQQAGFTVDQATYAAAVLDKSQVASRLGISFDRAWNGTGIAKDSGQTGSDYAAKMSSFLVAASDPRNQDFTDYINRAAAGKLTPQEQLNITPQAKLFDKAYGTPDPKDNSTAFANDNLSAAVRSTLQQLGVSSDFDSIQKLKGGVNNEGQLENGVTQYIRQKMGLQVNQNALYTNQLQDVQNDPVISKLYDSIAAPILQQYK